MGSTSSFPNLALNIKCNCCVDGKDMVQPRRPSWFRKRIKNSKGIKDQQDGGRQVVETAIGIQSQQTIIEEIPDEEVLIEVSELDLADGFNGDDSICENQCGI